MDTSAKTEDFEAKLSRFKRTTEQEKLEIFEGRKPANTNRATRTWLTCFNEYLVEKQLLPEAQLSNDELPAILTDFYVDLKKKNVKKIAHKLGDSGKVIPQNNSDSEDYKNTSLKCIRAALNRHFKATRNIDIITNEKFIQCNEMFQGVTKKGKREGRGEVESKPPIEPEDMERLSQYFTKNMKSPPNPAKLQEIVLFNVIYFGGRRGRENLRNMKINTFEITKDAQNRQYIHQVIKEHDKNHTESDFQPSNEARIYEKPGHVKFYRSMSRTLFLRTIFKTSPK